ncbi:hypothetical protein Mycsm_06729 (plasmid) [Mycobacterium sp. JS623]|nr:hypothetical protein Mycsm_06729 [Mycobacterium sp. JS623]
MWPARRCAQGTGLRCATGPRGLAEFFSNAGLLRIGRKELRARTIALSRRLPAGISSARRQTKTGGPRPRPEREIMTGTLEHLDPTALVIGENVRDDTALDPRFLASVAGRWSRIQARRTSEGPVCWSTTLRRKADATISALSEPFATTNHAHIALKRGSHVNSIAARGYPAPTTPTRISPPKPTSTTFVHKCHRVDITKIT